jgi:hypothetical protein
MALERYAQRKIKDGCEKLNGCRPHKNEMIWVFEEVAARKKVAVLNGLRKNLAAILGSWCWYGCSPD